MANDAPSEFVDTPGVLATAGSFYAVGSWIGRTTADNQRYNYEKIIGPSGKAGSTRQVYSHAHSAQSSTCGVSWTPDLINNVYTKGSEALIKSAVAIETWTELDRQRTFTVGNTSVATEIYAIGIQQSAFTTSSIKFRVKYCLAADSASCGATVHYLEEATAITMTSAQWHTIKGQVDGAGGTVVGLTIDGPTSVTDPGDTQAHIEAILEARSVDAPHELYLYAWRTWAGGI